MYFFGFCIKYFLVLVDTIFDEKEALIQKGGNWVFEPLSQVMRSDIGARLLWLVEVTLTFQLQRCEFWQRAGLKHRLGFLPWENIEFTVRDFGGSCLITDFLDATMCSSTKRREYEVILRNSSLFCLTTFGRLEYFKYRKMPNIFLTLLLAGDVLFTFVRAYCDWL